MIELHNGEDSRITTSLINDALWPALDMVEKHWTTNRFAAVEDSQHSALESSAADGALIIVGKRDQDKFFSNGFVYDSIKDDPSFFAGLSVHVPLISSGCSSHPTSDVVNPLFTRLLTFPSMFVFLPTCYVLIISSPYCCCNKWTLLCSWLYARPLL